jgi:DNA helicase-2/ATP-dependent DNA helicase PcrA
MDDTRNTGRYILERRQPEGGAPSGLDWGAHLNEQQLAAVTAPNGPVLVLAGAGSGKTRVITHRVAYLISERRVRPWNILLTTFTNKAARHMLAQVEQLIGESGRQVTGGTFHHVANLLLRRYAQTLGYGSSFTILDESDARQVMKLARTEAGMERGDRAFPSERLLLDIGSATINTNTDLETLLLRRYPHLLDQLAPIERVIADYTVRKQASNQMDFDDLLVNLFRLLTEQPQVRAELAQRFHHILVDEYQDVNHIQARIVEELYRGSASTSAAPDPPGDIPPVLVDPAAQFDDDDLPPPIFDAPTPGVPGARLGETNVSPQGQIVMPEAARDESRALFVVGDDAQSIYSFRGADYENIRNFPYQFDGTHVFKLEVNYRSTPEVLRLANGVLSEADPMFHKELHAVRPSTGQLPLLLATRDVGEQAEFLGEQLLRLREDNGIPWRRMAVLYRAHSNRLEAELELQKRGIPFVVRGGLRFFEQAHIKDLLSYVILLINDRDELAWQRMLAMTSRVGPKTIADILRILRVSFHASDDPYGGPLGRFANNGVADSARGQAKGHLIELRDFMRQLKREHEEQQQPPADLLRHALDARYQSYMEVQYENWRQRQEDLEQLIVFASRFKTLATFLAEIGLQGGLTGSEVLDPDAEYDREEGAVTLSTVHQAKGLEWQVVFIIQCQDDVIPHRMALLDRGGEDEERRLMYVALTRAEEMLFMSFPQLTETRDFKRIINRPSRFIAGLPKDSFDEAVLEWN